MVNILDDISYIKQTLTDNDYKFHHQPKRSAKEDINDINDVI